MDKILMVITTFQDKEEARALSRMLLEKRLIACAQIIPSVESLYWWQNEIAQEMECIVWMKTHPSLYPQLHEQIRGLHSYETPEIISLETAEADENYLRWLKDEVRL